MNDTSLLEDDVLEHDHGCKVLIKIPSTWMVEAAFSGPKNCYRTKLKHVWDASLPMAMILMMNPSGASIHVGDQSVMKTSRIFRRLGYGGQFIGNACALRHVTPKALLTVEDPVGPGNVDAVLEMAAQAAIVVVAHGRLPKGLQHHADAMCEALRAAGHTLYALKLSKTFVPMHPLARGRSHVKETTVVPFVWNPACV